MGEKKISRQLKLISLEEALAVSNGYFTRVESLRNLICRGKLKRHGPPKRAEVDYFEFMEYLGRPADV